MDLLRCVGGGLAAAVLGWWLLYRQADAFILACGLCGYGLVAYLLPSNFFRRMSVMLVSGGLVTGVAPEIDAVIPFPDGSVGGFVLSYGEDRWPQVAAIICGTIFGVLEFLSNRSKPGGTSTPATVPASTANSIEAKGCIVIIIKAGVILLFAIVPYWTATDQIATHFDMLNLRLVAVIGAAVFLVQALVARPKPRTPIRPLIGPESAPPISEATTVTTVDQQADQTPEAPSDSTPSSWYSSLMTASWIGIATAAAELFRRQFTSDSPTKSDAEKKPDDNEKKT